jgi:hypothetical protein
VVSIGSPTIRSQTIFRYAVLSIGIFGIRRIIFLAVDCSDDGAQPQNRLSIKQSPELQPPIILTSTAVGKRWCQTAFAGFETKILAKCPRSQSCHFRGIYGKCTIPSAFTQERTFHTRRPRQHDPLGQCTCAAGSTVSLFHPTTSFKPYKGNRNLTRIDLQMTDHS